MNRFFTKLLTWFNQQTLIKNPRLDGSNPSFLWSTAYANNKFNTKFKQVHFNWAIHRLPEIFNDKHLVKTFWEKPEDYTPTYFYSSSKNTFAKLYDFGEVLVLCKSIDSNIAPEYMLNGQKIEYITERGDKLKDEYKLFIWVKEDYDFTYWEHYTELMSYRSAPIPDSPKRGYIHIILQTQQGLTTKRVAMREIDVDVDLYYDEYISRNFDTLCDNVNNTENGIFIFHGLPGTGKTYLIREIARRLKDSQEFIFLPASMSNLLGSPNFVQFMLDYSGYVLVIEDAENVLISRESTMGSNPATSNILQLGDGFLGDVFKMPIMATFNSDIQKIDEAILRKGRCLFKHEFKELPTEQVNRICESIGIKPLDRECTLTEIFNKDDESFDEGKDLKPIGFQPRNNENQENHMSESLNEMIKERLDKSILNILRSKNIKINDIESVQCISVNGMTPAYTIKTKDGQLVRIESDLTDKKETHIFDS